MNQLAHIPNENEIKMANLRRPSSKDKDIVGWFNPNGCCKKHPKHRQSPGVCSLCLKDKLSQLPRKKTTSASAGSSCNSSSDNSSLSSYYSSSTASSCASPMHPFSFATKGKSGSSLVSIFLLGSSKHGLVKSRSMAVVPRRKDGEEGGVVDDHNKKSAKKSGFWFKLLHPKSKRSMKEKETKVVHSRSARETVSLAT